MGNISFHVEKIKNLLPCYRRRQGVTTLTVSPLHEAVRIGDEKKVLKILKKKKIDVNVINSDGFTPLHYAVKYGHPHLIKILMDHGGDINKSGFHGLRPFHMLMVSTSRNKCLEELLKYEPDINAREILGNTILQIMVMIAPTNTEVIMKLLENGSDPNNLNIVGNNCLHNIAMLERHVSEYRTKVLAQALLKKGLDPNCKNKAGNTPLHFAAGGNPTLVGILIEGGADINLVNNDNLTAFDVATKKNDIDVIKHFIKHIVLRLHRGLEVKASTLKKIRETEAYESMMTRYENEMVILKMMKLSDHSTMSFYDLISRKRCMKSLNFYRQTNCAMVEFLSYKDEFYSVVNPQVELLEHKEDAYNAVNVLIGDELPHLCVEKIAEFLKPEDLTKLRTLWK